MRDYWIVSDIATGAMRGRGTGPEGSAAYQQPPAGQSLRQVTADEYDAAVAEATAAVSAMNDLPDDFASDTDQPS